MNELKDSAEFSAVEFRLVTGLFQIRPDYLTPNKLISAPSTGRSCIPVFSFFSSATLATGADAECGRLSPLQ